MAHGNSDEPQNWKIINYFDFTKIALSTKLFNFWSHRYFTKFNTPKVCMGLICRTKGLQTEKRLQTVNFNRVPSGKKTVNCSIKLSKYTLHTSNFSMEAFGKPMRVTKEARRCICGRISWQILPAILSSTSSIRTLRQVSFGTSVFKASFTVQSTKRAIYRRSLFRMNC